MSTQLVSNFEVLLEPITPIPPSGGQNAEPRTMRLSQVPRRFRLEGDADAAFPVPQVIQGYFLLIGNPSTSPAVTPTITVEADQYTIGRLVSYCLALTQIDGKATMSKFTSAGPTRATVTLPQVDYGANFAIVGNYASSTTPPLDLRGNVYMDVPANARLVLNPQTRAIFTTADPTAAPGEVAYSMITPTGGSVFSFTSTSNADELFAGSAKGGAPEQVQVPSLAG